MPRITFVEHDGTQHTVEVKSGVSVMQAAVEHMLPGVIGDCGGHCQCATCHGYVDPAWFDRTGARSDDEAMMLDGVLDPEQTSRLTCQIVMNDALDGLVIRLPRAQA